ncbi:peptidase M23B [Nautilia profundicola AmH]|uniref:Peptidase M23B n=1 Tax=Nautilia profundicola (strain ATCC BAA-1463 / DSM 18972 / AmH) TaxID=598659 RepID=B9L6F0_NAUPA|nr:M23 family metallopeptidase [Nautilia profundicola]ACM93731.1 peptidase M23B [Nautilia profundicola AmH]
MKKLWILILLLIAGAAGFVYFSPMFEKTPPSIQIESNGFTNLKKPLKVILKDESGIKYYRVTMIAGGVVSELATLTDPAMGKEVVLKINLPKTNAKQIKINIAAVDNSKWHFFAGNEAKKSIILQVDTTAPLTEIINNSYAIGNGGSAAAVVKVSDENLKDKYILVNGKYRFNLTPFVKKNYYVALIAWPVKEKTFDAELVAEDMAGNIVKEHIPYYWRKYRYPKAKIKISDKFINSVAKRVLEKMDIPIPNDPVEIFKKVNETVRAMNEKEIHDLTDKVYEDKISYFSIARFNPLPGSAVRAYFGEQRTYYYKGEKISNAIHKGIDLAKVKRAKIYSSNYGKVIAEKYIGIYGNTLIVYHKLGLYTLYGHTSVFKVKVGDKIRRGQVIARTGSTGAVFGDHLHFGVYVQGYAVNPIEWMDPRWIKLNVTNVINGAKRIINK